MDVASRLLHPPPLYGCQTAALSHSLPFASYRGLYNIKLPTLTSTSYSAVSCFSCVSRKNSIVTWSCYSKEQIDDKPYLDGKHHGNIIGCLHELSYDLNLLILGLQMLIVFHHLVSLEVCMLSKLRGICFYIVTATVAIFMIVLMLLQHPLVLSLDQYRRKAHHVIASTWAKLTITPFFNIKFQGVENLPPADTPAVYVSNHQSFLDIYTLLTLGRNFKFISKTAIFLYPIIGWAMSMLGMIPLKRMDSKSHMECLKRCTDLVKKGASVFFFPEGTRSKDGNLGAFKKGAFSIAAKTGAPVVPMTLMGTGGIMPTGKEGILNLGSVTVVIHKPIHGTDAAALCNEARTVVAGPLNHQS